RIARPRGGHHRGVEPVVDARGVGRSVAERTDDLPLGIGARAGGGRVARLRSRVTGAVDAVRTGIARVTLLVHLVVARLRAGGVDHARAARDLIDAHALAERRDREARHGDAAL